MRLVFRRYDVKYNNFFSLIVTQCNQYKFCLKIKLNVVVTYTL